MQLSNTQQCYVCSKASTSIENVKGNSKICALNTKSNDSSCHFPVINREHAFNKLMKAKKQRLIDFQLYIYNKTHSSTAYTHHSTVSTVYGSTNRRLYRQNLLFTRNESLSQLLRRYVV